MSLTDEASQGVLDQTGTEPRTDDSKTSWTDWFWAIIRYSCLACNVNSQLSLTIYPNLFPGTLDSPRRRSKYWIIPNGSFWRLSNGLVGLWNIFNKDCPCKADWLTEWQYTFTELKPYWLSGEYNLWLIIYKCLDRSFAVNWVFFCCNNTSCQKFIQRLLLIRPLYWWNHNAELCIYCIYCTHVLRVETVSWVWQLAEWLMACVAESHCMIFISTKTFTKINHNYPGGKTGIEDKTTSRTKSETSRLCDTN